MRKRSTDPQTGAFPLIGAVALPSLSGAATWLSGAIASVGIGTAISGLLKSSRGYLKKLPGKLLGGRSAGEAARGAGSWARSGLGNIGAGQAAGVAKAGLGTVAISKAVEFMDSGPEIGGVNILPVAAVGGLGILAASTVL